MTALPFDAWMALEAWRISLLNSLAAVLLKETTVEYLSYHDSRQARMIRFVNVYVGLTPIKIEVIYPEPIEDIVTRVLEVTDEHTH